MMVNGATLVHRVAKLLREVPLAPRSLLIAVMAILATYVIASSVLLWELERGGPFARDPDHEREPSAPDLIFPESAVEQAEGFSSGVCRLLVRGLHDVHRVQPHRHHAGVGAGQDRVSWWVRASRFPRSRWWPLALPTSCRAGELMRTTLPSPGGGGHSSRSLPCWPFSPT